MSSTSATSSTGLPQPFGKAHFIDPYPTYARLRAAAPVHRIALPDGSPVWLVTREADVRAGLTDPRLSVNKAHSGTGYRGFALPPALDANLLNIDPADHLRLRRLVSQGFTPRRVEGLRRRVQEAADRLADGLAATFTAGHHADIVTDFANPLPLVVIGDLFDVPEPDRKPFSAWVSTMFAPEHPGQVPEAIDRIHRFLLALIAARRAEPGDDLLSALIAARDEGDRLSEDELLSLAFLILMAGSENAQHLISGGLLTLLRHPGQLAELRADPALLPGAVEELLRYAHPNQMAIRRFPTEPVEIGGVRIPPGETVLLCLASAHRDPDRYPDPDRFDIHRRDKAHLALGQGLHYCLGAPLARMEIAIALETLMHRFPDLELAVPASTLRWRASFRSHALRELPVTGQPRTGASR
ncbi:cytochrome P450 [Streptomyces sp. MST-110588]|uniref:cytochrome P450 family protein n=1 Tax=Streptomyces sp. MST-110588 TaxID=2833628 RepID=UPI001F5D3EA7|nr:cytochrome P450 [Streptomyces sp. MST-110588]UNO43508.1 cytochrome P450 [Streptomyces sp. MST-110588]